MKKMLLMFWVACCAVVLPSLAATKGSCESAAEEISPKALTKKVTLVSEYDERTGVYTGNGLYVLKMKLSRGMAYTVWLNDVDEESELQIQSIVAAEPEEDENAPEADFDEISVSDTQVRYVLYADEWNLGLGDEDDDKEDKEDAKEDKDPKNWWYYIFIDGDVGETCLLNVQQGVNLPRGIPDNPHLISPAGSISRTASLKFPLDTPEYCFTARMLAGRRYLLATLDGTESVPLDIESIPGGEFEDHPSWYSNEWNAAYHFVPEETDYYDFSVVTSATNGLTPFRLQYMMVPVRSLSQHKLAGQLAVDDVVSVAPGRKNAFGDAYYDEIIDEALYSFKTTKGTRYLLRTEGATTNLLLRIYNSKGEVVVENRGKGDGTFDVLGGLDATATATYYVGVCQDLPEAAALADMTISLSLVVVTGEDGDPDPWDARDDASTGASPVCPVVCQSTNELAAGVENVDPKGHGPHRLSERDWYDTFAISVRKDLVYAFKVSFPNEKTHLTLSPRVYSLNALGGFSPNTAGNINVNAEGHFSFKATANGTYYLELSVAEGVGLDYPDYILHCAVHGEEGVELGTLKVNTRGTPDGLWSINSESVARYVDGAAIHIAGTHTVRFLDIKGFSKPKMQQVTVKPGKEITEIDGFYSDTFDPKDNVSKTATAWTLKNVETTHERTLWPDDPEDNFAIAGVDGYYYDIALRYMTCAARFSITNAEMGVVVQDVTKVHQLTLPKTKSKYFLTVTRAPEDKEGGSYTLSGFFANVGAIKWAKTAVSAKENAPSVALTVNRTAKDGMVRVRYGTVAGTAEPGVDYVAQNGVLEWKAGDNKAKTITVKLIPDLAPTYEGNKTFGVRLEPAEGSEYPAQILGGDTCTVTLTEVSKAGTTPASAYAAKAPKAATVKTEQVALDTGSFYGVLAAKEGALTNGLPELASVTLTASTAKPAALSAKVALAGKTYTFAAKGWDDESETAATKVFTLVQKVANVAYTNTLTVALANGTTTNGVDWLQAGGSAELMMNVPDANAKGVQANVVYTGSLYRNNAKIQDYLTAVTNFTGYYTVALVPDATVADGVPAGNGYLTLTVDNKGTVKAAGMLADGSTKPSLSVPACALVADAESACGSSLHVPLFLAKAPALFGGTLRLYRGADGRVLVDSTRPLVWNNDNRALTRDNTAGWRIRLSPAGGYYDTVVSLQTYYLTRAFSQGVDGAALDLSGDVLTAVKPAVVKLARATGLVSGTFTHVDASGVEAKAQKHFGVLVMNREVGALPDDVVSAGFFTRVYNLTETNPSTGRATTRKWTYTAPFDLIGTDLGVVDWWADDWGTPPVE